LYVASGTFKRRQRTTILAVGHDNIVLLFRQTSQQPLRLPFNKNLRLLIRSTSLNF